MAEKEKEGSPFWPRLNKTGKLAYVKTDFSKWKDEDEDDEEEDLPQQRGPGMSDQLLNMMGNGQLSPDMLQSMMGGAAGAAGAPGSGQTTNVNFEVLCFMAFQLNVFL